MTANAIAPGFIETEMTVATAERMGMSFEDFKAMARRGHPGGPGRPAGGHRGDGVVLRQRGCRVRLRSGGLRRRRATGMTAESTIHRELRARIAELTTSFPPRSTEPREFLGARFDAGLAWVHFPSGSAASVCPDPCRDTSRSCSRKPGRRTPARRIGIGLGMAAPDHRRFRDRGAEAAIPASVVDGRRGVLSAVQ